MTQTGLESLLPLRAITFTLRFGDAAGLPFFPHTAISAFVRRLIAEPADYDHTLTTYPLEIGHVRYDPSETMRFTAIALPGAEHRLGVLWERLDGLDRVPIRWDPPMPLRDNVRLAQALDGFTGAAIADPREAGSFGPDELGIELTHWRGCRDLRVRLRAPMRILREKGRRGNARGEWRYCRDRRHLEGGVWWDRLHDSFADLVRRRGGEFPARWAAPSSRIYPDVFWCDADYTGADGRPKPVGGLLGSLRLVLDDDLDDARLAQLVLGQYLGIGQRRAFGQGVYRLLDSSGRSSARQAPPARRFLDQILSPDNLARAWEVIAENSRQRRAARPGAGVEPYPDPQGDPDADPELLQLADEDEADGAFGTDPVLQPGADADRLARLAERLRAGSYRAPALAGWLHRDPDGGTRPLAVPPFIDRVAQRAVAQVLTPAFEAFMDASSYGYRPGRSRFDARDEIRRLYEKGYRWVFESDVQRFFDSVDWRRLRTRLEGLLDEDPVVGLILDWMSAPVEYQGRRVRRSCGLPQGAPLSPLLANVMLDDFDSDLRDQGLRLVRFGDDFLILAKTREAAEQAGAAAREALRDVGLELKPEKTRVVHFSQGFKYLGMLFVDGLAIEVKPESCDEEPAGDDEPPPPGSWLAAYEAEVAAEAAHSPTAAADGPATLSAVVEAALRAHRPVTLGHHVERDATLFVTGAPALLVTRGGRLQVERDEAVLHDCAWSQLESVCLFGNHQVTTQALRSAMREGVTVHYATVYGHWLGATWSAAASPAASELWLAQERRLADPAAAMHAARAVVAARLRHQHEVLRNHAHSAAIRNAMNDIAGRLRGVRRAADLAGLNGLEGQAARGYFAALRDVVPEPFGFSGRNRRPPRDPFNALLSLGYSMLAARATTLLYVDGLLPWRGFYHQPHGAHPVLASDLMEPFRHEVERVALRMLTQHRLRPDDFVEDDGACLLRDGPRRLYLGALSAAFDKRVKARGDDQAHTVLEHLQRQNRRLIAWIVGAEDVFEAWRLR